MKNGIREFCILKHCFQSYSLTVIFGRLKCDSIFNKCGNLDYYQHWLRQWLTAWQSRGKISTAPLVTFSRCGVVLFALSCLFVYQERIQLYMILTECYLGKYAIPHIRTNGFDSVYVRQIGTMDMHWLTQFTFDKLHHMYSTRSVQSSSTVAWSILF